MIKLSHNVSTVVPIMPTVRHRMFLSNLDLTFSNTRLLLFYKTESLEDAFCKKVETLKRSLSSVLVDFYPFAGRLDIHGGESGRPEVDCNDEGVEFVESSINMPFEDVKKDEFQHKSFFKELAQTHENSYAAPLLSIQVSQNHRVLLYFYNYDKLMTSFSCCRSPLSWEVEFALERTCITLLQTGIPFGIS